MDERVGAQQNDHEEDAAKPDSEEMPEPEPWVREELERIAEEARQMAGDPIEQVQELPAATSAEVEAVQSQAETAGDEVTGLVEEAHTTVEELDDKVTTPASEEMSNLVDEAGEAGVELRESLERPTVAAQAGMASATPPVRPTVDEARASADEVVRATRERIAVAEEMSMTPEYRGISFGDGFRFGCGFTVAGCLFWLILSLLLAVIPLALSALNVIGLPGR